MELPKLLKKLNLPANSYVTIGDTFESIVWTGEPQITEEFFEEKKIECIKEYDALQYQRDRQYPNLGEQFDLLFKDINEGTLDKTGGFYTAIKAVKDAHPKPSE